MLRGIFKIWLARRRKIDQSGFRERYSIKLILWFKCLIVGESFVIADGDDRNERWHEHDPTRWWGFEFAVVKSLLAVSKLPGVYCEETQIMNCYLYMIANYANDTYKHKYYVVNAWAIISGFWFHWNLSSSLKFEGKAQLSLKFEWRTQIWVTNSNLSETVWYPPDLSEPSNLSDHPELRESRQITKNWVLHLILRVVIYLFLSRESWFNSDGYPLHLLNVGILWFSRCVLTHLPGQYGRHFADDIFSCIFVNEKFGILIRITLQFVPKGPETKATRVIR